MGELLSSMVKKMGSGFVFKTIPYVLPKEKWGESTMLSVQLQSEENGASRQV